MLEIEYIPIKTTDGTVCGHARVRGGYVELSLKSSMHATALVITENGSTEGIIGARIPVRAQVSAIALHEQGNLRGYGFSRTSALQQSDLRRRLHAISPGTKNTPLTKPAFEASKPAQEATKPTASIRVSDATMQEQAREAQRAFVEEIAAGIPDSVLASLAAQATIPAEPVIVSAPAPKPQKPPAAQVQKPSTPPRQPGKKPTPSKQPAKKPVQSRPPAQAQRPTAQQRPPEPPTAPTSVPPAMAEEMDAISREAVQARAAQVYKRIETAVPPSPVPMEPEPQAPVPDFSPAAAEGEEATVYSLQDQEENTLDVDESGEDIASWASDVDSKVAESPLTSVPNPFPHIFPGAQFARVNDLGSLQGVWIHGTLQAEISAVPGPYSPQPPAGLAGYTRYIRARSGGYWVKVIEE